VSADARIHSRKEIAGLALATFLGLALIPTALLGQEDSAEEQAQAEKETPPPGGPPRDFRIPAKESFSLDNGLAVTLVPYGAVPKVNVQLVVRTGDIDEAADEVWLASLTGDMMQEGTATRSSEQLARDVASMGGQLSINVGADRTFISTEVLSDFGTDAVSLIADVAKNAALPEDELERLKADRVRQLSIQRSQPQPVALEEFRRRMYPEHPYGRVFPTDEMLQAYTLDQVRGFYDRSFGAVRSHLYVSGQFDGAEMREAIRAAFSDWEPGTPAVENIPDPHEGRAIYLIDRPGAPQSTIYMGLPVPNPSDDEYVPQLVANSLLGGSFSSRITRNIREDKGYTYSPFSQVSTRYRDGYWLQTADVTTDVTGPALEEIFSEIDRLQREPPPEEELRGIQNFLAGIFVLQNSSRSAIINQLAFLDLHGLTDEYVTGYVNRIYSVTPEDVQHIAQEYLRDEDMMLVVVGDRSQIADQLSAFGEVTEVAP
jgi:predicted Zn-dependent peptidase